MKRRHDGDCTIYSHPTNGRPFDGVCTCGYGWSEFKRGNTDHMVSSDRWLHEEQLKHALEEKKCESGQGG